jgi:hypothetical protein
MNNTQQLTIKYLIDLLNNNTKLTVDRRKYLIDSYPTLKINLTISYYNLLTTLLIAYKNIDYQIDNSTLQISLDASVLEKYFKDIEEFIRNSSIDQNRKKKNINFIHTQNKQYPPNDSILILSYYFGINLIIYNNESQTIKYYYYDNQINIKLPYILIKETKDTNTANSYYELIFSQNKFIFDYNHPLIIELIPNAFIIGFEQNKKLEYLELNNINEQLTEISNRYISQVKLKVYPSKYIKLIKEFQNTNFEYI